MSRYSDFAVIGGGASGLAAAIAASDCGDRVIVLEKNPAIGRKIAASGNGRCNLMNLRPPAYYGDSSFANAVLSYFPPNQLIRFWNHLGLYLSEEKDGRLYPCTFHSGSVIDVMKERLRSNGVDLRLQSDVTSVFYENGLFHIHLPNEVLSAKRILIATGGIAFPRLGSSSSGCSFLQSFGHKMISPFPSLCPLITDSRSISGLSGLRARCSVSLFSSSHRILHQEKGEVLFTETGISGICIMQCARFIDNGCYIKLDFIRRIIPDQKDFMKILKERRERIHDLSPDCILHGLLLPKLAFAVAKQAGINLKGRTAGDLSDTELLAVCETACGYIVQIKGPKGFDEAQVTAGGIDCGFFAPDTLESRLVPGLHASGEVLNVDGDCGGFNLMFAFASGILAGINGRKGKAEVLYA